MPQLSVTVSIDAPEDAVPADLDEFLYAVWSTLTNSAAFTVGYPGALVGFVAEAPGMEPQRKSVRIGGEREPDPDPDYSMYTHVGNRAVADAVKAAITVMSDGEPGALERALATWATEREAVACFHAEVHDTAVRERVAHELEQAALARTFTSPEFEAAWERWAA